nr:uncharacterized protein LOC113459953 [Zonotrichia albicollis]
MGTQFGTVGQVTIATGSVATSAPRTEPRHSQGSHECMGSRVTQECDILGPGHSQGGHVPGLGCYIYPGWGCPQGCPIPAPGCPQGCSIPGQIHPMGVTSQECPIPYWDVPSNILLALGCQDGDPGDGDTPQGDITHRMLCLSGLILSGLIVPGAGMPAPPLCGSTGTIRVPATDRILSLAGSGSELEENGKNGSKKLDTMTLIKEDMDIFGHCPAHDEFYLVVCNHCSQVVKPQAFQKHCGEPRSLGNGCSTPWCWEQHWECHQGWLGGYSLGAGRGLQQCELWGGLTVGLCHPIPSHGSHPIPWIPSLHQFSAEGQSQPLILSAL